MKELPLQENRYNRRTRRDEPRLKHWSSAGLMLTYWCSSRCACCYVYCGPQAANAATAMSPSLALSCWQSVLALAGERGKVHITGGEPFYHYDTIRHILQAACDKKLPGLEKIETNAYWCTNETIVRQRLTELKELGLTLLQISTDIYHQEFIPIESVRLCYQIGREVLGEDKIRIRWRDFLQAPILLDQLTSAQRVEALAAELKKRPERMVGRAAHQLAPLINLIPYNKLADLHCRAALLGAGHVHIDGGGHVFSGTCAGIILCKVNSDPQQDLLAQWKNFDPDQHPLWAVLTKEGPCGLARIAGKHGFVPGEFYASKCHLCFDVRKYLFDKGLYLDWLGPAVCYGQNYPDEISG